MEQHAFHFSITAIFKGTYDSAFQEALAAANRLHEENNDFEIAHILVTETGFEHLGEADGVFCEGCEGHAFPGIRWPTMIGTNDSRSWLERCDTCERFESDEDALNWLAENYGYDSLESYGHAKIKGYLDLHAFLETR